MKKDREEKKNRIKEKKPQRSRESRKDRKQERLLRREADKEANKAYREAGKAERAARKAERKAGKAVRSAEVNFAANADFAAADMSFGAMVHSSEPILRLKDEKAQAAWKQDLVLNLACAVLVTTSQTGTGSG